MRERLGIGDRLVTETIIVKRDASGNVVGTTTQRGINEGRNVTQEEFSDELDTISMA